MGFKDYITIITAIVASALGIINFIMNIQGKLKENIKLYCNNLEIKYKLKGTEEFYEDVFIKIPLNINYSFDILNNKNKSVPVEDVYMYTTYNEILDNDLFNSEYLEISHSKNNLLNSVNGNSMKKIEITEKAIMYLDKRNLNDKRKFAYEIPFLIVLCVKIDRKIYRRNIKISIIIK